MKHHLESSLHRTENRTRPLTLKGKNILYVVVIGMLCTLVGVFIASRSTQDIENRYRLEELIETTSRLQDEQRILKSELAYLRDPNRVLAKLNNMDLRPMDQQFWVYQTKGELNIGDEAKLLE